MVKAVEMVSGEVVSERGELAEVNGSGPLTPEQTGQRAIGLLKLWRGKSIDWWQFTADVGDAFAAHRAQLSETEWARWLEEEAGITPVMALVLMRAGAHRELLSRVQPSGMDALMRLLPSGPGTPLEADQARLAREMAAAGTSRSVLRRQFGCSAATLARWLDPDGSRRREKARAAARRQRLRERREQAEVRARAAAVKAAGGPAAKAFEQLRLAQVALDAAVGEASGERRRLLSNALQASYVVEDRLAEAARL